MGCSTNCGTCNDCCGGLVLPDGPAGVDGQNAYTVTTANFTIPAVGANVSVSVSALGQSTGLWAQVGQVIYIQGAGYYEVVSATATVIVAENLGYTGNAAPTTVIALGAGVSPGGVAGTNGSTGATGAAGADGTTILGYERDGGNFTSLTYTQIRGPYAIPANSWESVGDTVRVKLLLYGSNDGTPDATNHIRFNFKMKVGATDVVALPSGSTEYAIRSNDFLHAILVEVDLVAKSFAPFVLEVVPKGNLLGLYTLGVMTHTPGTSGLFAAGTISGLGSSSMQYQPSVFITSGIDPTISNDFSVEGKHTVVGTGGSTSAEFACPFSLVELLKK